MTYFLSHTDPAHNAVNAAHPPLYSTQTDAAGQPAIAEQEASADIHVAHSSLQELRSLRLSPTPATRHRCQPPFAPVRPTLRLHSDNIRNDYPQLPQNASYVSGCRGSFLCCEKVDKVDEVNGVEKNSKPQNFINLRTSFTTNRASLSSLSFCNLWSDK